MHTSEHDNTEPVVDAGWIDVSTAARLSGLTESYLRRLARDRRLDARRDGRRWLLSAEAVAELSDVPESENVAGWEVERQLLYAERAELQLEAVRERLERSVAEAAALRAENARLRAALSALVVANVSDGSTQ